MGDALEFSHGISKGSLAEKHFTVVRWHRRYAGPRGTKIFGHFLVSRIHKCYCMSTLVIADDDEHIATVVLTVLRNAGLKIVLEFESDNDALFVEFN